jgi:hypothetical protein
MERSTKKTMKTNYQHLLGKGFPIALALFLFAASPAYGQEQPYSFNRKIVNWGLKIGLNANAVMHLNGTQGDEKLENLSFRNQSGCDLTGFFRVNLDRFFIQPEIGWSTLNKAISFSFPSEQESPPLFELQFRTQTANANGLIGYNITKTGPFTFNVLTGTSLRYKFHTRFSASYPTTEHRDPDPVYNAYGVFGFSMNIANTHFDIRYAISMLTTNMHFNHIADKPDWLENVVLNKSENLLSFSCGLLF